MNAQQQSAKHEGRRTAVRQTPRSALRAPRSAAIILAGGRGTRLGALYPGLPKPMLPAAGRPFIAWVLRHLADQGLRRAIVSVGHLAEVIESYLAQRPVESLAVQCVREPSPLGTGGGARLAAQSALDAERFVVVNGDSLALGDLSGAWPLLDREDVDGAVVGLGIDDAARYGTLEVGRECRLEGFREKRPGSGIINAGVYFLKRRLLDELPRGVPLSLETDVFPAWLAGGVRLRVLTVDGPFLDIGTPESAREAERFIRENFELAGRRAA